MKRIIMLLLCVIIFSTGCNSIESGADNKIVPPENKDIALKGKWTVSKMLPFKNTLSNQQDSEWVGKSVEFSEHSIVFGESIWDSVNYKMKTVGAEEYCLYKYKQSSRVLGINDKELHVITVMSSDKFLYEFAKIADDEIITSVDDGYLYLKRVSGDVDTDVTILAEIAYEAEIMNSKPSTSALCSGVLLGIRSSDEPEKCTYRSLWISSINSKLQTILEADDIFLPRKSGFWKVEVKKTSETKRTEDIIVAYSVSDINSKYQMLTSLNPGFWREKDGVLHKKILYVGNDYISIETSGNGKVKGTKNTWRENRIQTLPVDKISNENGVKVSDISGQNGTLAVESAINELFLSSNVKTLKQIDTENRNEDFALFRKTGHWFMKGRVNFEDNEQLPYMDFNINLIPSPQLVFYDTLHIPWTDIKDRIPEAVDAYTSPNKDIAIVVTRDKIYVFSISRGKLSDQPLVKIKLKEGDSVVMAEWALGSYMNNWQKTFVKNNATRNADVIK